MTAPHLPKVAGIDSTVPSPAHTVAPRSATTVTPSATSSTGPGVDLQDRLAGLVSDLTTLHELTERLALTATLSDALEELLRAGAALVGARRGLVVMEPSDGLGPDTTIGLGLARADLGHIETVPRSCMAYGKLLDTAAGLPGGEAEITQPDLFAEDGLDPRHREVAAQLGYAASYALPLSTEAAGRLGAAVWLYDEPAEPVERQRHLIGRYARHATEHLARLLELERTRACLTTMSEELLPSRLPRVSGVQLAARHRTGPRGGGDWYDALPLPDAALGLYARYATEHLARLLELDRTRACMKTISQELLPPRLPRVSGVQLAARHRTGPRGGGDWYDALPLPDAALGLAVGSVTGSGPSAVAAMGRLRASLRAYAVMEGEDPVAVLSDLELLMRLTEPARSATALFAFCEPALRKITLAGAGHSPPLVIGPRRTEFVETSLSAPLGMLACWEAPSVELSAEPGETVLLYTDGLLHRTGDPMDRAFARLHAAASSVPRTLRDDPGALADHVLRTVLPDGLDEADSEEDVVLLAARFE